MFRDNFYNFKITLSLLTFNHIIKSKAQNKISHNWPT